MVSVFTSADDRVDETIKFMAKKCSADLVRRVRAEVQQAARKKSAGEYIKLSLGFDSDARRALRALMLCQYLFVDNRSDGKMTDWGKTTFGTKADTKEKWKNKTAAQILNGVAAHDMSGDGNVAEKLEWLGQEPADNVFRYNTMTRDEKNLGAREPICYQSIAFALWLAGHASIAWLATWYASLNAGNCFTVLGPGAEIADVDRIMNLRGTVVSFRAREVRGAQTVNHWAVIVGDGCAIGSNTDGFKKRGATGEGYDFIWGERRFGKFDILECIEACNANTKYRDSGGVRVATHRLNDMDLW